ncbi:hypothetical protein KC352_g805, partial [Hortaea werneckii]
MWQRRRNDPTLQEVIAEDEASWEKEDDRSAWGQSPPQAARGDMDFQSRIVRPEDDEAAENVLWQRFETIEHQTAMDDEEAAASVPLSQRDIATDTTTSSSSSSPAHLDYLNLLPTAIAHESHHLIARCLRTAIHHDDFTWIRSLPETTFTQILTLLSPSRTLGRHIETHTSISSALTTQLHITPLHEIVSEYSELLGNLLQIRCTQSTDQPSPHPVTLTQYNLLLRSAATLGNRALALRIWKKMTTQTDDPSSPNAVVPDIESYNALMSAVTFNRQLNAPTRHRYRVIPFHMHARNPEVVREADRGAAFKGYSKAQHDGTKAGQLPLSAVGELWETMTARTTKTMKENGASEGEANGYNVQPNMRMYDYLVKNLVLREMGPAILQRMREGRALYLRSRKAAKEAWQRLLSQAGIRGRKGSRKRHGKYDQVGKNWRKNKKKRLKKQLKNKLKKQTPSLTPPNTDTHPPPSPHPPLDPPPSDPPPPSL